MAGARRPENDRVLRERLTEMRQRRASQDGER